MTKDLQNFLIKLVLGRETIVKEDLNFNFNGSVYDVIHIAIIALEARAQAQTVYLLRAID